MRSTMQVFPVISAGAGCDRGRVWLGSISSHRVAGVLWSRPALLPSGRLGTMVVAAKERLPSLGPSAYLPGRRSCPLGTEAPALSAPRNHHCKECVGAGVLGLGGEWKEGGRGGPASQLGRVGAGTPGCFLASAKSRITGELFFSLWRPNGFAWLGNPEGTVSGKGEGVPHNHPPPHFWRCSLPTGIPTMQPRAPAFLPGSRLGSAPTWHCPPWAGWLSSSLSQGFCPFGAS